jgi:aromatic-L-amino-acid decarboxylase
MLAISPEEFRAAVGAVTDAATRFLETLDERTVRPPHSGEEVAATLGGDVPERGLGPEALDALDAVADRSRAGNGRFFAYVAGSGEPIGAQADFYAR